MLYLLPFFVIAGRVFSENILFITVLPSHSHHIWHEVLVQGLLSNGHNITLIGHDDTKIQSKNYTVLTIKGIEKVLEDRDVSTLINSKNTAVQDLLLLWDYYKIIGEYDLKSEALKTLLDYPRDIFDLIVFDLGCGQYFYPLIEYFGNPPVVGVSPFALTSYIADAMGSPFHSYYPLYVLPYTDKMTFVQRLENLILHLVDYFLKMYYMPSMYEMAQKRFGKNITDFQEVEKNITILLTNNDPVLDFPQAFPPHIIPVGGLHIKPAKRLSKDLQKILDNAEDGVIYFSFGTNVQPSWLSSEKKKMLLDTFSRLKQTVLWNYDGEDLPYIPKNVIIRKWYQQNNILGHKNVKLFITHSGGLSTQEAMYHGVPVIVIPFFIDQRNNAGKVEAKMVGKKLLISSLIGDTLYDTIQEVISNPMYKDNMLSISTRFRDQKETPLERAVFWIEYVLRHKNVKHLSPSGRYMTLWERQNIDVLAFMLALVFALIAILIFTLKSIAKKIFIHRIVPKLKKK